MTPARSCHCSYGQHAFPEIGVAGPLPCPPPSGGVRAAWHECLLMSVVSGEFNAAVITDLNLRLTKGASLPTVREVADTRDDRFDAASRRSECVW